MMTSLDARRLRRAGAHWKALRQLLTTLERCTEACARLDAYRTDRVTLSRFSQAQYAYERRMDHLTAKIDREISRVTVERLWAAQGRVRPSLPGLS